MIPIYATIGKILMQKERFASLALKDQKLFILAQFCYDLDNYHWRDKQNQDQYGRMLELHLDTNKKTCRFLPGSQLHDEASKRLMIFTNYAPNDPNIYGSHTSIKTILGFELQDYVESNVKDISWSSPDQVNSFIQYLSFIKQTFYLTDEPGTRLKYNMLELDQQTLFPDPGIDPELAENISDKKKYKKLLTKKTGEYLNNTLKDIVTERQAYALCIDGKLLHESEHAECYIDVLYHYIFGKQFYGSKYKGNCHLCSKHTILAEDVALKQKFYGTTNPLYFDNLNAGLSNLAFSMCQQCYEELTAGTQYAASRLKTYLLGMNTLVLPEIRFIPPDPEDMIDPDLLDAAVSTLRRAKAKDKGQSLYAVKLLQKKLQDFSLLFYYKPSTTSQQFIVNGLIRTISIESLIEKTEDLDNRAAESHLGTILGTQGNLSLEGFRYLILPSKDSHPQLKPSEYHRISRSMIQLLSTYLHNQKFYYKLLISQFVDIFNRRHNHLKPSESSYELNLSPYLMNIYLNHLIQFNQLEGVPKMEGKQMTIQLTDESLLLYFANNSKVYEGNFHAQGLFILGMYVSNVESEQRRKKISAPLINRLNLRGIPTQKVKSVMALVDEMRRIWKTYNDPITDSYLRECMGDIDASNLMPEDVVYHILSGRAYSSYLSITHKKNQENISEDKQEEQND